MQARRRSAHRADAKAAAAALLASSKLLNGTAGGEVEGNSLSATGAASNGGKSCLLRVHALALRRPTGAASDAAGTIAPGAAGAGTPRAAASASKAVAEPLDAALAWYCGAPAGNVVLLICFQSIVDIGCICHMAQLRCPG